MTSTIKITDLGTTIKSITQSCIVSSENHDHQSPQKEKNASLEHHVAEQVQKYKKMAMIMTMTIITLIIVC